MTETLLIANEASRQRALDFITNLSREKVWEVTVAKQVKRRSTRQNSLLWAWMDEIAKHVSEYTGYEKDDVHEYLKHRFLPVRKIEIEGVTVDRYTTTKLSTAEMAEYSDKVFRWASHELGLVLPLPPCQTEER